MTMRSFKVPASLHLLLLALFLLSDSLAFAKRKDDQVVMKNGDKFTGEIKSLEYGELVFKSDYMEDSVHLDWKEVASLRSQDVYIVSLSNGQRVTGLIDKMSATENHGKEFKILAEGSTIDVAAPDVITIRQREGKFWNQLTGSISYGFGYASDNNATNSSLGADVAFRTAKNAVQLATSSQFSSQTNAQNTNRFTFDSYYARMLNTKWSAIGLFTLLKSNQQNLELRSTYGGGFGRRLLQTDRTSIMAIGGAVYSHENYVPAPGTEPIHNNAEAILGITFSTFRFSRLDLNSQTFVFPSISDPGRLRLSSQSNLKVELVRNFWWNFQFYENYDTRPPVNAPKNDTGVTTSVGWTF